MIPRATLTRIDRAAVQGRTRPILAACETMDEQEVDVFVKLSAGCDQGVVNLAREAIAACLAIDLGLPVPEPYLVEVPEEIIPLVAEPQISEMLRRSCPIAFGSTSSPGFSVWTPGQHLTDAMRSPASGILLFDAIIQNPDRRTENPNCLVRGDNLRIIDHDLAFTHEHVLLWQPPWREGGMSNLEPLGNHIFVQGLKRGGPVDFRPIRDRWNNLPNARLQEYERSIPPEWADAYQDMNAAFNLIGNAKDNIDGCIRELGRILS